MFELNLHTRSPKMIFGRYRIHTFTRWDYHSPNMGHKLVCYLFRRLLTGLHKHFNWTQRDLGQNNPVVPMA